MTVDEALAIAKTVLDYKRLNKVQETVFEKSWQGQSYGDIAKSSGYDTGYVKDAGSKLWQSLSEAFGEKVTKNNLHLVLKRYQQQQESQVEGAADLVRERESSAASTLTDSPRPYQNLPPRNHTTFIGRKTEIAQLLQLLSFDCPTHCISVQGIGGAGKTALVLEAAYRLQASQVNASVETQPVTLHPFEAIIFTSAKQQNLTPSGILPRLKRDSSLRDIFRAIARTLQCPNISSFDLDEQLEQIQASLARQRTLLIVDNVETIEEQQPILSFLYELPSTVKAVITGCERTPFFPLRLEALPERDGIQLIQHQATEKGVFLLQEEFQSLYQQTGGIPAAIVYAIGQLAAGYLFPQVLPRLSVAKGDFCRFYFEGSVTSIKEQPSHQLLMALAMFSKPASGEAIAHVAAIPPVATADGLAQLQQLSLIRYQQGRYDMLPLTRGYALAELQAHPDFEQEARNRWVNWYLRLSQEQGNKDWKEWNEYQQLEAEWENLSEAMEWCIAQNRYTDVRDFWQAVKCYTYDRGRDGDRIRDWNTPLEWIDWLMQAAERAQDWATALEAMFDRGRKLILRGQPKHLEAADALFTKAWALRHHQNMDFHFQLATQIAVLRIEQQQFVQATHWLEQAKNLLKMAQKLQSEVTRSLIHLLYYEGEICYKTQDYHRAKELFQQVLEQAQLIGWQRAIFLAKDWLADIAIEQRHLDEAHPLLLEGLRVAERNQDKCRTAYAKRSLARFEAARGELGAAYNWATAAREGFESLGMIPEAEETQILLQTLGGRL